MTDITFENVGESSYIVRGSGKLPVLKSNTDAISLDIRGFSTFEEAAFKNFRNLVNITFDDSLTVIANMITFGTKVVYFTIPKNVHTLIAQPFDNGNEPMIRVFVHPENKYFTDIDGVVYSKDLKKLYFYPGNHGESYVIIPKHVEELTIACIGLSHTIKYVRIPSSVKVIEKALFLSIYILKQ